MARTWLSIRVDLVDGAGLSLWPRPGRIFAAARSHSFDLGDNWAHLCTVGRERIDALATLGITPERPMPYWGWGSIP